ncbi:hypothetical protein XdyCFBP7245_13220 [Xanthomonas dyei]|uniref:Alpha/beta hydrolase fold-3 domain-containing protein n=1 Tax=Xanthomonas dyei TaxID=743699 RepID=A0A2S7C297_9XANT|nr:hypothetical protein XdyCFBP7245_13220 [Xanthomonas dyei]
MWRHRARTRLPTPGTHVWDGLGHGFHRIDTLPESQQALRVTARFFSRHLGLQVPAAAVPR